MAKDEREHQESEDGMSDRRKRVRILDGVSASSGVGSVGVGIFILNMLMNQGDTQKDHGRWIHENTQLLEEMHEEFRSDIRRFEDEHTVLRSGFRDLELQSATAGTRLQSLEQMVRNPQFLPGAWSIKDDAQALQAFEVNMKTWVDENFEKKSRP